MKTKLRKFTEFTQTMLPHEAEYLLSIQQFQDPENLGILQRIQYNCENLHAPLAFDTEIDKRKYSHLKSWITDKLDAIDVDKQYEWLSEMDRKIMTDSIMPDEEKQLMNVIKRYDQPMFYFMKFYELIRNYRHYLLIRMRYKDYELVCAFLNDYKRKYSRSQEVNDSIHTATVDIVEQYQSPQTQSRKWEDWLINTFYDEELDGLNRYLALIRLTFMYINYREFDKVVDKFDHVDEMFQAGISYSKRLLVNYYSNRLILHSKFDELEKAEYYGYLSIRHKNTEYLHYVNNLSAILMRQGKSNEAMELMREAFPDMKSTFNYHNKTGFVAFYLRCLNMNSRAINAERYAETFIKTHKTQLFEQRWHLFFSAYLQSLFIQEKYNKVLRVVRKFDLIKQEVQFLANTGRPPVISWYYNISEYKEGRISQQKLSQRIKGTLEDQTEDAHNLRLINEIIDELHPHVPMVFNQIRETSPELAGSS